MRAALEWCRIQGRADSAARLAGRAHILWQPGEGHGDEGRRWLTWALQEATDLAPTDRAGCLTALAQACMTVTDPAMVVHARAAIELADADVGGMIVHAYGTVGMVLAGRAAMGGGDDFAVQAREAVQTGLAAVREAGPPWTSDAWGWVGVVEMILRDVEAAEAAYARAVRGRTADSHDTVYSVWVSELTASRVLLGDPAAGLYTGLEALQTWPEGHRRRPWLHLAPALARTCLDDLVGAAQDLLAGLVLARTRGVFLELNECLMYAGAIAHESGSPVTAARLLAAAVSVGDARATPLPFRSPASGTIFGRYSWLLDLRVPGRAPTTYRGDDRDAAASKVGPSDRDALERAAAEGAGLTTDAAIEAIEDLAAALAVGRP